jgi:hypothetical protein
MVEREDVDVLVAQAGLADRLADVLRAFGDVEFGDAIAAADREPLADVEFGEISIPCRPGEELTSMISGPASLSSRSTPATRSPMIWAARTAVSR